MRWHAVEVDVDVLNILRMNNVIYLCSFFFECECVVPLGTLDLQSQNKRGFSDYNGTVSLMPHQIQIAHTIICRN